MSPVRPCPHCGKQTDFHKDELERVEDGSAVCLQCGLEVAQAAFILEVVAGEHPHLLMDDEEEGDEV